MPPLPPGASPTPRIITYYQTHHDASGQHISILPLLTQPDISITHVILAAIHINDLPQNLTLNDHAPSHPRYLTLWAELRVLQASGIKVLGMLGGAAQGTYERLDQDDEQFERYYAPLRDLVRSKGLDGLDLDVEEDMTLHGIVRLIDRLRSDFGPSFLLTMAPVAAALLDPTKNLSGFDYEALEVMRGREIAWYNAQFYWGWGDLTSSFMYDMMIRKGWPPEKVVVGVVTSPENGKGFVPKELLAGILLGLKLRYHRFGGVMGWEFFNSMPGGRDRPWEWARDMTRVLRGSLLEPSAVTDVSDNAVKATEVDPDVSDQRALEVPDSFEYYSDEADQ